MYVTEQQLKEQLQQENTVISEELLEQMLYHIGSLDPILRDELIFSRLAEWIMSETFTAASAKRIVSFVLSSDGLFYQLKTSDETAVFIRSFSALLLAVVLEKDAVTPQLGETIYEQLSDQLLMYLNNETDFRGQVPSYGWAHSIAHIADVYQVWLAHPRCRVAEQQPAIIRLIEILTTPEYHFIDEEHERVISAWMVARERDISDETFFAGLESAVKPWLDVPVTWSEERFNLLRNTKQLLQAFYFRVKWQDKMSALPEQIEHLLFQIHQQYQ